MDFYLLDRTVQIIHFEDLRMLDHAKKIEKKAAAAMSQNEVFVLQIAAVSSADDCIQSIQAAGDGLEITCINTQTVDKFGVSKTQQVQLKANEIAPLFFTVESEKRGARQATASICVETQSESYAFDIDFSIDTSPVENHGYNDLWRLSRLKWLNSALAQDESLVRPFVPPQVSGSRIAILGREIELAGSGLPQQIYSKYDESIALCDDVQKTLFARPCVFVIGKEPICVDTNQKTVFHNRVEVSSVAEHENYSAHILGVLRYDGQMEYAVKITAKKDFEAEDVSLSFYIDQACTQLMHGLGHRASKATALQYKWNADKQQDCIFIGAVNCGMRVKFKAEDYRRPLINIFYKNLPLVMPQTTWDNGSKGRICVDVADGFAKLCASTGRFCFKKDETRSFDFEIHITPFKPLDYKKLFGVRYLHNNRLKNAYKDIDEASRHGLNYVIFHQGNSLMPYINYPFYETDSLKKAAQYAAEKGIGIKLYYTEREHSNHMAETFVYKALGDEIVLRKKGVSHSWQKEKPQWLVDNFGEDIIPGWFVKYNRGKYKGEHDISFIVRPDTRLDNYYVEGLQWLIENIGISGIYIDDTSLDRTTIERAKKLLDKKDGLIDMHMWNHEEPRAGDVSCLNLYCELLPFLDSIWLGEGFFYKKYSPEYMLCEVSGIPYGVSGQMLQDGGDLYEGMLYAMNNRYGWGHKNAVDMYKVWDSFGIEESKMLGYWHSKNPVRTDNAAVLTTVYLKEDSALLAVYNFSNKKEKFSLNIDRGLLGFDCAAAQRIKFGSAAKRKANPGAVFALGGRKGMLLLLTR